MNEIENVKFGGVQLTDKVESTFVMFIFVGPTVTRLVPDPLAG